MRITNPPPDRTTTTLGMSLMNLTFKSQGGFAGGKGTWLAAARRGYLDIVLGIAGGFEGFSPTYYDVLSKVQYQLSPRHLISGHLLYAGDRLEASDDDDRSIESSWNTGYGWINWTADFTSRLAANTVLSTGRLTRNRTAEALANGGALQTMGVQDDGGFEFVGVKQDWSLLWSERLLLKAGFDIKAGQADYDYLRWNGMGLPNLTDPAGPTLIWIHDTTAVVASPQGYEAGLYVANRVQPVDALTAEVGVRYDHQSHTGDNKLSPRVNVALSLGGRTTLRGAWGLFHQSHGLSELMAADGDDRFYGAQRAEHRVLGLEHHFVNGVSVRLEGYERRIVDPRPEYRNLLPVIELVPEAEPHDRVRLEPTRGIARGVELAVARSAGDRFAWSANYSLAVVEDEIDGEWVARPFDQRHTVNLEIVYRPSPKWSLSSAWQYHSPWPTTSVSWDSSTAANGEVYFTQQYGPMNAERMTPYHRLDARVSRHFLVGGGRLSVYLDVFNVYSRGNARTMTYYLDVDQSGRLVAVRSANEMLPVLPTLGARWEF
jgi:outer membrane receptor protein involved in Fe transport